MKKGHIIGLGIIAIAIVIIMTSIVMKASQQLGK
jgi:hypothetical protein